MESTDAEVHRLAVGLASPTIKEELEGRYEVVRTSRS